MMMIQLKMEAAASTKYKEIFSREPVKNVAFEQNLLYLIWDLLGNERSLEIFAFRYL